MNPFVYLISILLLALLSFLVFRVLVQRDYQRYGQLTTLSSILELIVFTLYMSLPYFYNPPEWTWFWSGTAPVSRPWQLLGIILIAIGMILAFGTMLWFGIRRAFGMIVDRLIETGPYRYTRNPQIVGGALMVLGVSILWPSWYALGWMALYGLIGHMMVVTEEEHLNALFGEDYQRYSALVPRYFSLRRQT